jgi:Amt family ammonium transporter
MTRKLLAAGLAGIPALLAAVPSHAAALTGAETGYLFNTLFLLVCGALVMFMAAGFAMLEAGTVRSKSVAVICAKNIALYALAGIAFYLVGYQLMYGASESGIIGEFAIWRPDDRAALSGAEITGHASSADWFFQMVFVATAASVVSGALAERIRFWPFALSTLVLAGLVYPVVGHWTWGGGWLAQLGFADFAGSTIVHSVGGWVGLTGIMLVGARRGRFGPDGRPAPMPPSSLPYVTLGTFILWLGWFGFNGGSQLSFSSVADAVAVADIFVNTNAAAAAGVAAVAVASQLLYRRLDLPLILNGALAGLVSITAEPVTPTVAEAMLIGGVGALLMMAASWLLERLRLDDAVGAVPVHLAAGVWGTLAVALSNPEASLLVQAIGVISVGAFVGTASWAVWIMLGATTGLRLRSEDEETGGDLAELGVRAHNFA